MKPDALKVLAAFRSLGELTPKQLFGEMEWQQSILTTTYSGFGFSTALAR